MNEELLSRLSTPEDNFTERKPEGVKREELRKTIVAFANSVRRGTLGCFTLVFETLERFKECKIQILYRRPFIQSVHRTAILQSRIRARSYQLITGT